MGNRNGAPKKNKSSLKHKIELIETHTHNNQHLRNLFIKYMNDSSIANKERYAFIHSIVSKYPKIDSKELEKEFNFFEIGTGHYNLENIIKYQNKPKHRMNTEAVLEMDLMRECYYDFLVRLIRDFKVREYYAIQLLKNYTLNINYELNRKIKTNDLKDIWNSIIKKIEADLLNGLPQTITNYEHYIRENKENMNKDNINRGNNE